MPTKAQLAIARAFRDNRNLTIGNLCAEAETDNVWQNIHIIDNSIYNGIAVINLEGLIVLPPIANYPKEINSVVLGTLNAVCIVFGMKEWFMIRDGKVWFGDRILDTNDRKIIAGPLGLQALLATAPKD